MTCSLDAFVLGLDGKKETTKEMVFSHFSFIFFKVYKKIKCVSVRQSYRDLIKLCVQQSINFSKLYQIYQDRILTPTLTITPNPNSVFQNFGCLQSEVYTSNIFIFSQQSKIWYKPRFKSNQKFSKSLLGLGWGLLHLGVFGVSSEIYQLLDTEFY